MKFRYKTMTQFERSRDLSGVADELATQVELARQAGFNGVSVSEHHATEDQYLLNEAVLGYLAGHVDEMSLRMGICLLPYHNPVRIAEFGAAIDVLTGGNFHFAVGQGYRQKEFDIFGIDRASAVGRMVEGLEVIERLWTEDNVTFEGEYFAFEDVSINPKPLQRPRPPITMGASNESSVRRAARISDGWIAAHLPFDVLSAYVEAFRDERAKTRDDAGELSIGREVYVAETTEAAERIVKGPLMRKYEAYIDWGQSDVFEEDDFESPWEQLKHERFIVGSPDDVIEEIGRYQDAFDPDYLGVRTGFLGMEFEDVHASIELFGEEVLPSLD